MSIKFFIVNITETKLHFIYLRNTKCENILVIPIEQVCDDVTLDGIRMKWKHPGNVN